MTTTTDTNPTRDITRDSRPGPGKGALAAAAGESDGSGPLGDLSPGEAQAQAREAWRRSGHTLTGAELAERYGRSERWGRQQIAAARTEDATNIRPAADGTPGSRPSAGGSAPAPATAAGGRPGTAAGVPARQAAPRADAAGRPSGRTPGTGRHGTAAARQAARTPLPLLAVTVAAVVVVTVVCAVVSYSHIRDLAEAAGMGSLAGWLPLGIDGLVVAASCSLIVDRQLDRRGHPLAWAGVVLGLAGSLAANVLAVDPDLVSLRVVRWALAGYGPAALAVSGHLLFRMLGEP
jgi:hypothetical protein